MRLVLRDLKKAEHFATIFRGIPQLSDDVNILLKKDKFYIQAFDQGHICLFELVLSSDWFDEYSVDDEDIDLVGFNTTFLHSILKCKGIDQPIEMSYEGDPDKIEIVFDGTDVSFEKVFDLPLITINTDGFTVPGDYEWEADFEMKSAEFQKLSHELITFSDVVTLYCSEESFSLSSEGMGGKYKVNINLDDLTSYSIDEGGTVVDAQFNLRYFNIIASFSKLCKNLKIDASSELPLKITYYLGTKPTLIEANEDGTVPSEEGDDSDEEDLPTETNYIRFYLAAKIKEEFNTTHSTTMNVKLDE